MSKCVMIVAAHTDDEVLGCGGTIARHVSEGDNIYAVFIADGVSSRGKNNENEYKDRKSAAEEARKILGIRENYYFELPDNRLDSIPLIEVVQRLELIIDELKPAAIYTHHGGDLNVDHRITNQAVLTACRPIPSSFVREIYSFEIMSSTEWSTTNSDIFSPNYFVDIGGQLDIKMKAIGSYANEMRDTPHSRSKEHIKYLAHHRGHSVGMDAAEAFMMLRFLK